MTSHSLGTPIPSRPGPFAMLVVSELQLGVYAAAAEYATAEWKALCEWCRFHSMDPERMPADQVITRNPAACRVEYDEFVYNDGRRVVDVGEDGRPVLEKRRVHAQGETPPLPFPDLILRHIRPIPRPETA